VCRNYVPRQVWPLPAPYRRMFSAAILQPHLIVGCFPQPSYNRTIRQPKKLQCEIPTPSHRMHYSCLVFHFILFVPSLARNHRVTSAADVINRSIHHGTCVIQRGRQRVNRMLLVQVQGFYETTIGIHQLKILLMAYFQ